MQDFNSFSIIFFFIISMKLETYFALFIFLDFPTVCANDKYEYLLQYFVRNFMNTSIVVDLSSFKKTKWALDVSFLSKWDY